MNYDLQTLLNIDMLLLCTNTPLRMERTVPVPYRLRRGGSDKLQMIPDQHKTFSVFHFNFNIFFWVFVLS